MPLATEMDACREYARNAGAERPLNAWIHTPQDTWERNPFYAGPPVPHPYTDEYNEELWQLEMVAAQDELETFGPQYNTFRTYADDEIPF